MPPGPDQQDALRTLNRTPHPYHHQSSELPHSSERFTTTNTCGTRDAGRNRPQPSPAWLPSFSKDSTPGSESGTEADDEHFLRGLPAPKARMHKGLRDGSEPISGTSTPMPSPAALDDNHITRLPQKLFPKEHSPKKRGYDVLRRNRNLVRRATETGIIASLGYMVVSSTHVSPIFRTWSKGSLIPWFSLLS